MSHIETLLSKLTEAQKATKASGAIISLLNKTFDREYAKLVKVKQDENIVEVIFPIESTPQGAVTSIGGKDTMSGQSAKKSRAKAVESAEEFQRVMVDMYDDEMEDHWVDGSTFGFVAVKGKFF